MYVFMPSEIISSSLTLATEYSFTVFGGVSHAQSSKRDINVAILVVSKNTWLLVLTVRYLLRLKYQEIHRATCSYRWRSRVSVRGVLSHSMY